jgi:hypothetical protein
MPPCLSDFTATMREAFAFVEGFGAGRIARHGADFLAGDLMRFDDRAKPLPHYKSVPMGRAG